MSQGPQVPPPSPIIWGPPLPPVGVGLGPPPSPLWGLGWPPPPCGFGFWVRTPPPPLWDWGCLVGLAKLWTVLHHMAAYDISNSALLSCWISMHLLVYEITKMRRTSESAPLRSVADKIGVSTQPAGQSCQPS